MHSHQIEEGAESFNGQEITWFNHDDVDLLLGTVETTPEDSRAEAAEILAKILVWVWLTPSGSVRNLHAAITRFTALSAGLKPGCLGNASYPELATRLGISKAAISKCAMDAQKTFNVKFARSRSAEARANMRQSQQGHPNYHHGKEAASMAQRNGGDGNSQP